MRWTDAYIRDQLPSDPIAAGRTVCGYLTEEYDGDSWFEEMLDDFAFLQAWIIKHGWQMRAPPIDIEDRSASAKTISRWASNVEAQLAKISASNALSSSLQHYQAQLGLAFSYQLTDGDMKRIQDLIGQLRTEISSSTILTEDQRRRLLSRLEKLQSELHKHMSDYDRAYGILVDGIVLVQKFGEAVEPITRLIQEIGNLFWRAQGRFEELPGDSPLPLPLPPTKED